MTLDEWKALQNKEKQTTAFNVRKPGEGCDNKQWKQTYVLKKKVDEHDEEEEESDDEVIMMSSISIYWFLLRSCVWRLLKKEMKVFI